MIQEDAQWCPNCGTKLSAMEAGRAPSSGDAYRDYQPDFRSTSPESRIREAIRWRMQTDEVISSVWVLLPLIGVFVGVAVGATFFLLGGGLLGVMAILGGYIISAVFFAILNYKLFNRNNQHSRREAMLRTAIVEHIRNRASERGASQKVANQVSTMESINHESITKEREHNAALWAILPIIPIIGPIMLLIALYYLTDFPPSHDRRWHAFTQQAQSAGTHLDMTIVLPSWRTLPDRSYFLYLIVTVLIGIFILYWYYALIKDMNDHFRNQWQFEDQLIKELE